LLVGSATDLLRVFVDLGDDVRDLVQRQVQVAAQFQALLDHRRALFHVFDGLARFLLNSLNQIGDFLCGLRRFLGEFSHFLGDHREAKSMFAGPGSLDRGIERQ